ncbi:uncharacterized protein LOC122853803 [Aphidius gifuensis]|uniref:uncharacterized protein LOC122853803 n=1 Tax=Aphidius gifuensis TaxID=684658 RepID=UPI001CDC4597|nr:uncharacterized protein LOC122853803 [Aphidius gifuensis]
MTSATVALLTSYKLKLQHLQKSGGTMQNKISTSSSPIIDNVIQADSINKRIRWTDLESAFQKRMTTGMFEKSAIKLNTILACNFEIVKEEEIMIETKYFTDGCIGILQSTDLDEVLTKNFEKCNLNYQESCAIAVVFHGLSNYDSHFLIKQLKKQFPGTIDLLALNKESYISFTKHVKSTRIRFRFIDSYKFMASSISTLANELEDKDKSISLSFCNNLEEFKLITKKGLFPYDYIDSWEKFNEQQLPSKLDFYSQLYEEHITEIDYNHACNVWEKFHIKNLGEYSDLYLRTDVLLLADIFDNFRYFCLKTYELDPAHYFTLPGLSFNAMLKFTEIELELITDADKLLFIEGGIRGGLSQCSHRHVIANNKYISEYNPNIEDSYLMYFDVNNLYGFAMASTLPVSDFQWEENFDIHLPLAPERRIPPLSTSKCPKLLATLYNREKYIIHYKNLKQYVSLGMKIRKLYRVLKFKQRAWLKPYIDLNTELRTKATSLFAKNLFKSLINISFGKMLESTRSQRIIKLVSRYGVRGGARALISKPNFHSALIIDD